MLNLKKRRRDPSREARFVPRATDREARFTPAPTPYQDFERVVIVVQETQLDALVARFGTAAQAKFYLEHGTTGGNSKNFAALQQAHDIYYHALEQVKKDIPSGIKSNILEVQFVPQYSFAARDLVLVLGQDGLVSNTAKYLDGQPVLAINPNPELYDGVLLPFLANESHKVIHHIFEGKGQLRQVSLAQASLSDGQKLTAFNDFFIGANSHVSARYTLKFGKQQERQSSSGLIVSTGVGSTGWLRSVYAGATGIVEALGGKVVPPKNDGRLPWDSDVLVFAVREPFPSSVTGNRLVYGLITKHKPLVISSHMADNGVVFSDDIEKDFLAFNAGLTTTISLAKRKVRLFV